MSDVHLFESGPPDGDIAVTAVGFVIEAPVTNEAVIGLIERIAKLVEEYDGISLVTHGPAARLAFARSYEMLEALEQHVRDRARRQ